ncbi:MAG: HDIG domain-containing protein [Deltaproteobacteria bacterium]|nr:HDIG domain-containing protein [Deltaproteobacteria bacterium]
MLRTRARVGLLAGIILSVVFAALFTAAGSIERFVPALAPRFGQAAPLVVRVPLAAPLSTPTRQPTPQRLEHARVLVPRGTVLSPQHPEHRAAVQYESAHRPPSPWRLGAELVLYLFACLILTNYARRFGHSRVRLLRSQVGLFCLMLAVLLGGKALLLLTTLSEFWIPVGVVALWVTAGFDRRTGLLVHLALSFMVASLVRFDLLLLGVFATRGMSGSLLFFNRKRPRQMLLAGALSGLVGTVAYVALVSLLEAEAPGSAELSRALGSGAVACLGGGVVEGLIAQLLREPAQLALGHISRDRLLDLTDIEHPLLQKMARVAPGSWEHSRVMANLAEAASAAIGADSLLTRVGAYFHDVGKAAQPKYFVENLAPGERSPHEDLGPDVSADAIMAHVVLGTKMLREAGVPEIVVEFVYTHHGTQLMEYFWHKYQENREQAGEASNGPSLGPRHFRYPGMRPLSKETAIVMLVDSVEAASRTVSPPEHDKFEQMIQRVAFSKVAEGQLDDSGLTISDLRVMIQRLAAALLNMYHGRIKYPWQTEEEPAAPPAEGLVPAAAAEPAGLVPEPEQGGGVAAEPGSTPSPASAVAASGKAEAEERDSPG